ncbi:MAG: hypothetical protein IM631_05205 [Cytophagales bacterium]|jgi:hypothetical protein|nr:hypothetical protein [Cytophagales bacterium]MCA6370779.1 hypothetical protein [Cytophagales bacterium]MCA6385941.1 hypothetical protein [Cytophagales bacterium]
MKSVSIIFSLFFLFTTTLVFAQDIPEPDFTLRPYYLDGNELKNFEKTEAIFDEVSLNDHRD